MTELVLAILSVLSVQQISTVSLGEALGRERLVAIVTEERTTFLREFRDITGRTFDVAGGFDQSIGDRAASVQVTTPQAAEPTLRGRFRTFLGNFTGYLLATNRKVMDLSAVDQYLEAAAKASRCGEIPCQMGCAANKPCDFRCAACTVNRGKLE